MASRTEKPAANRSARLRQLPSVDELLNRPGLAKLAAETDRILVVEAARRILAEAREQIVGGEANAPPGALEDRIAAEVRDALAPSLVPVINATGVVLHTNLGRAPLGGGAMERLTQAATRYTNLEYDLAAGARGRRDVHTAERLARLLGAEAAVVVNNNAAAVFLVLNSLARGGEAIVSRGELIEIGDGFRIPDIMSESGAVLREVGTTNRTRLADYERATGERTRLVLRVHPSNFRMTGFTARPTLEELVALGRKLRLPVYEDLGSGLLVNLAAEGVDEPVARASLAAGADVISFSGDKLLGGPQAGIIAGRKEPVGRIRKNPLFRALRVDKLTIAALEWTLAAYLRGALDEIPALRMIRTPVVEIERRGKALAEGLAGRAPANGCTCKVIGGESVIGGGSTPDQPLATKLVAVRSRRHSVVALEERLRRPAQGIPVIARIEDDWLVLDLRTVFPEEDGMLAEALAAALV